MNEIIEDETPGSTVFVKSEKSHERTTHHIAKVIVWSVIIIYFLFSIFYMLIQAVHLLSDSGAAALSPEVVLGDLGSFLTPLNTVLAVVIGFYFGTKN